MIAGLYTLSNNFQQLILITIWFSIFNGLMQNFDAAVGSISILANRYQHAEFTAPYTESGLVMIVPVRSRTRDKAWLFIKPFTNAMWVLIGATTIYNGFVIWLIERNHCPELKGSISNQVGTLIWLAFSTLFSLNGKNKIHFLHSYNSSTSFNYETHLKTSTNYLSFTD